MRFRKWVGVVVSTVAVAGGLALAAPAPVQAAEATPTATTVTTKTYCYKGTTKCVTEKLPYGNARTSASGSMVLARLPFGVSNIGWHWCCPPHWKAYFGKYATSVAAAAGASTVAMIIAGCTVIGGPPAAFACGLRWGSIVAMAQAAKASGKCLYVAWSPTSPWWMWPGMHSGSGCR